MSDTSFFVPGLRLGEIVHINEIGSPTPLPIKVTSGVLAGSGLTRILKGEIVRDDKAGTQRPPLVAIKVILTYSTGLKAGKRICRELRAVEHLQHDYILPFIGSLVTNLFTVIVSEFMENGDMLQYLKANSVKRVPLIHQVAIAVDYVHNKAKIAHGDLKCENVLISKDGDARLADFGFSTPAEKSTEEITTATDIRICNTPRFAAPEVLLDDARSSQGRVRSKTPQADVYAFGMLILQAFSGTRPWPDLEEQAVMLKTAQNVTPLRPETATAAGLTDSWWDLCQRCWEYDPQDRPSILEVEEDINKFCISARCKRRGKSPTGSKWSSILSDSDGRSG